MGFWVRPRDSRKGVNDGAAREDLGSEWLSFVLVFLNLFKY